MDQINKIIKRYKSVLSQADILAIILNYVIKLHNLTVMDYAIIAGYGLREYREVGDLDVALSKKAFKLLKASGLFKVNIGGVSKTEQLFIAFPQISNSAEMELFELENKGFPSDKFSLRNMQKNNYLQLDMFGNPHLNTKGLADMYSSFSIKHGKIFLEAFEVPEKRLKKAVSHLTLLYNGTHSKYVKTKLNKIEKLLDKYQKQQ